MSCGGCSASSGPIATKLPLGSRKSRPSPRVSNLGAAEPAGSSAARSMRSTKLGLITTSLAPSGGNRNRRSEGVPASAPGSEAAPASAAPPASGTPASWGGPASAADAGRDSNTAVSSETPSALGAGSWHMPLPKAPRVPAGSRRTLAQGFRRWGRLNRSRRADIINSIASQRPERAGGPCRLAKGDRFWDRAAHAEQTRRTDLGVGAVRRGVERLQRG